MALNVRRIGASIGPALVVACVCIGPGSILTSSKVGAAHGYSKVWVVIGATVLMLTYTVLASRLGVVTGRSAGSLVAEHGGRPLAVTIGMLVFFIAASYQFGNNLGVYAAIAEVAPSPWWIPLMNGLALVFVFGARNLYRVVETAMAILVGVMLVAFAVNLGFARPDPAAIVMGLNPLGGKKPIGLPLMGLVGTTFVISNAFYQSYLVRYKGWTEKDLQSGILDAGVGSAVLAAITLMIMCTAAAVFHGAPAAETLNTVADVGRQLEPFFGTAGRVLFGIGLFAAALSSFVVNSMVGGFVLSDGLGLGSNPNDRAPRLLTALVLVVGMSVALFMVVTESGKPVGLIVAAQAATVLAAPLIAGVLLWLTNLRAVMGEHRNGWIANIVGAIGIVVLVLISANIVLNQIAPVFREWVQ